MRTTIIAGNWKMYKNTSETSEFLKALIAKLPTLPSGTKAVVCPPFTSLSLAHALIQNTPLELGAQNMLAEDEGAFTGEISPGMLTSCGCRYVILGHSERRQYFGETNEGVNKKAKKALLSGLIPIVCVGETLSEREKDATEMVVSTQVRSCLNGIPASDVEKIVMAYEPVWAIGTGRNATPDQAQHVHQLIRKIIGQLHEWSTAERVVIQYGGSVKPENAKEILNMPDVDGALVGGASLKVDSFASIVYAKARG
ncbi:MAG TPA: triose-phosphate isomerase [Bacteroidota bacterium]|nr:triose-phosphate isomerase [Bacteroidota bacterium]